MDKLVYINEFLKQRQEWFGLSDLGTVSIWSGKGQDDKRDYDITHFKANFNNKTYRCYAIGGDENVMLELISDDDICNTNTSIKISEEFELINCMYISGFYTLKLDLNNVKYITCNKNYICSKKSIFYLKANNLRLFNYVYYDDITKSLRLKGYEFYLSNELDFLECEIAKLQYYTEDEVVKYNIYKRKRCLNTLKKGDVGYEELGVKSDGILYSVVDFNLTNTHTHYREVNFIDEEQFITDCRFHNIEAANYENLGKREKKDLQCREGVALICSYDEFLNQGYRKVVYDIKENAIKIYILDNENQRYTLFYVCMKEVEKFTYSKGVIDLTEKVSKKSIAASRQEMIDTYNRSITMNLVKNNTLRCEIEGKDILYSYDDINDLLILHNIKSNVKSKSLTIPAVFDATLPFFSSDLEYLDLNNVQYIIENRNGFNSLSNLKILKGDKLRLSQLVNLKSRSISSITHKEVNRTVTCCEADRYMIVNDIFCYIGIKTNVCFTALEFHMKNYNRMLNEKKLFCKSYQYFNNIKRGSIGYKEAKEYEKRHNIK